MGVDLRDLPILRARAVPFRLGGTVRGSLGGAQHLGRLGDRWAWEYTTSPVETEPFGRRWAARLARATREGALIPILQPGLRIGPVGAPVVAVATASGRSVPVAGAQPGCVVVEGQWLSIVVDGTRYCDHVTQQAMSAPDGTMTLSLLNLIRVPLPAGAVIELAEPKIEGSIDDDFGGGLELDGFTSFSFTVTEDV